MNFKIVKLVSLLTLAVVSIAAVYPSSAVAVQAGKLLTLEDTG